MTHLRRVVVAVYSIHGHVLIKRSLVQTGSVFERKLFTK